MKDLSQLSDSEIQQFIKSRSSFYLKKAKDDLANVHDLFIALFAKFKAKIDLAQFLHWNSSGPNFYSEHLLFQKIYQDSLPNLDLLMEKFLPSLNSLKNPQVISQAILSSNEVISSLDLDSFSSILELSKLILDDINALYGFLKDKNILPMGTDDLLMSLADQQDNHIYLLSQRFI